MSRIRTGYEDRFRALLRQARARRLEPGVQWLLAKATALRPRDGLPLADDLLLHAARRFLATLLTTAAMLMERRLLRDRVIPVFWLPPTLSLPAQLALVFREFGLVPRGPRCMSCGGEVHRASKEALRDRIPPRTYRWWDEFFVCRRGDKLFWHGTHWQRIRAQLSRLQRHSPASRGTIEVQ